jgi:hypothetical protein
MVTDAARAATSSSWKGVAHVQAVVKNVEMRRKVVTEQGAFMAGPPKNPGFEIATKASLPSVESLVGPDLKATRFGTFTENRRNTSSRWHSFSDLAPAKHI